MPIDDKSRDWISDEEISKAANYYELRRHDPECRVVAIALRELLSQRRRKYEVDRAAQPRVEALVKVVRRVIDEASFEEGIEIEGVPAAGIHHTLLGDLTRAWIAIDEDALKEKP